MEPAEFADHPLERRWVIRSMSLLGEALGLGDDLH